jgi:hypothetical protein
MRWLRIVAYGVIGGLAMSGAAQAARLHMGVHLGGGFYGGWHGVVRSPGLYARGIHVGLHRSSLARGLDLQQQGICSVLSGHPCHPAFCSVFQRGPCLPYYLPPLGEILQLTITTDDDNDPAVLGGTNPGGDDRKADKPVDTINDMFAALRACWVPPPRTDAQHGMQYTVRFAFKRDGEMIAPPFVTYASRDVATDSMRNVYHDAVQDTLDRCTPLHFTDGMAGAIAGRPIAVRFVDNRTIDKSAQ